jgi:hypothetical protein
MLNERIVVTVTKFNGTTTSDVNGKLPVMLQLIAGTMPNRNVLSGTVAETAGFQVGRTYLATVREAGIDKLFGADYTFTVVQELKTGKDIIETCEVIGEPNLIMVDRPEGYEGNYQRKGDAVESNRTVREKEGLYVRSIPSGNIEHETAKSVKEGTSVGSGGKILDKDLDITKQS